MNTFDAAFLIACASFVVIVWGGLYLDTVGPGLGRIVARIRDAIKTIRKTNPRRTDR